MLDEDVRRAPTTGEPVDTAKEAGRRIQSYCRVLDEIISKLDKLLALATESDIILADELARLKVERNEAAAEADVVRQKLADSDAARRRAFKEFEAKLAKQKSLIADLKKRVRGSEREFERLARENFGTAVAIYLPRKCD